MTVRDLYNAAALRYDSLVASTAYAGPAWIERFLLSTSEPKRVIDFGCANGILGRLVRARFPYVHLVGFDISDQMIEQARSSLAYDVAHVHDLNLPIPQIENASIDLAMALGFAEFLEHPEHLLAEVERVLTPGGSLVMSFQEFWPAQPTLAPRFTHSGTVKHHAHTPDEVRALFHSHGLDVTSVEPLIGYVSGSGFACPYLMVHAKKRLPSRSSVRAP